MVKKLHSYAWKSLLKSTEEEGLEKSNRIYNPQYNNR